MAGNKLIKTRFNLLIWHQYPTPTLPFAGEGTARVQLWVATHDLDLEFKTIPLIPRLAPAKPIPSPPTPVPQ